jgi:Tfp pilus assembly protein PilX
VQQVAHRPSAQSAAHAALRAADRKALARRPRLAESPAIDTTQSQPPEPAMHHLPTTSVAVRLNAVLAAAIVTLVLLSGLDTLAVSQSAGPELAQAGMTLPA